MKTEEKTKTMKVTIKVEGIFDYGEGHGFRNHTMEVPLFEEITPNLKSILDERKIKHGLPDNFPSTTTSIESQIEDWLDENVNFLEIFDDMHPCINYEVIKISTKRKPKPKKQKIDQSLMINLEDENGMVSVSRKDKKLQETIAIALIHVKEENRSQMLNDLQAIYNELKDVISDLTVDKQVSVLFKSIGIAYQAGTESLRKLSEYSEKVKEDLKTNRKWNLSDLEIRLNSAKTHKEKMQIYKDFKDENDIKRLK